MLEERVLFKPYVFQCDFTEKLPLFFGLTSNFDLFDEYALRE